MAKYQEMCNAANNSLTEFNAYRDRAFQHLGRIVGGLVNHCEVPREAITFLKWNGDRERWTFEASGGSYSLVGATVFDDEENYWHLGVRIKLSQLQHMTFVLCVGEQDGAVRVRVGIKGKGDIVDLNNEAALNTFCDGITEDVVRAYSLPKESSSRTIGFKL